MAWKIEFTQGAEKDLRKLDKAAARRVIRFLRERLQSLDDPRSLGDALHGPELGRFWKYRVGHYRIVASIRDDELVILVVRVRHRGTVYR